MNIIAFLNSQRERLSDRITDALGSGVSLELKFISILFSGNRSDYYQFLADMIEGTKGKKSLMDIFISDANRYGSSPRGRLSAHWAKQFDDCGGSLERTFKGTLPDQDVAVLHALQQAGGVGSLEGGLRDLAHNNALVQKAKVILFTTMIASIVCLGLVFVMAFAMPLYTVPKILSAFSFLPADAYPESANNLISFADFVTDYWLLILIVSAGLGSFVFWSLSNVTGLARRFLDKYGIFWSLYRDFQSMRFITSLSSMIKKRGNVSTGLKAAIEMQLVGASRWKKYHIDQMLAHLEAGIAGSVIFSTGIMDKTMHWYLTDLIESRGLEDALDFVRSRIETKVISRISLQSATVAWVLMIFAIFASGYLMFWQMQVMDDMVRAMQIYMS